MAVINNKVLLTQEGYNKLKEELKRRETEIRVKLQDVLNQMRNQGDLKENDGYNIAVEDFQNNEEKILDIKNQLENAEVVKSICKDQVGLGCTVKVQREDGDLKTYTLVGEGEVNPLEGKVSYKSPLGESLMEKKKGSEVTINTPSGENKYKIISID
jgi:transcription elongation factor GreA